MTANPPPVEPTTDEDFPYPIPYPGYGSRDDVHARIMLLDWIRDQLGCMQVKPGDHILATDGRILGVGEDSEEIYRLAIAAEPSLVNARLVDYCIPLSEY